MIRVNLNSLKAFHFHFAFFLFLQTSFLASEITAYPRKKLPPLEKGLEEKKTPLLSPNITKYIDLLQRFDVSDISHLQPHVETPLSKPNSKVLSLLLL